MCCSRWGASRTVLALALLLGLVLIVPSHASAQAVTGTLLGNVTDTTGAAVPGATVTVRETQTNVSRTATTNETGFYTSLEPAERHLRRRGRAPGIQEGPA